VNHLRLCIVGIRYDKWEEKLALEFQLHLYFLPERLGGRSITDGQLWRTDLPDIFAHNHSIDPNRLVHHCSDNPARPSTSRPVIAEAANKICERRRRELRIPALESGSSCAPHSVQARILCRWNGNVLRELEAGVGSLAAQLSGERRDEVSTNITNNTTMPT
jgi:hypothetical protein